MKRHLSKRSQLISLLGPFLVPFIVVPLYFGLAPKYKSVELLMLALVCLFMFGIVFFRLRRMKAISFDNTCIYLESLIGTDTQVITFEEVIELRRISIGGKLFEQLGGEYAMKYNYEGKSRRIIFYVRTDKKTLDLFQINLGADKVS